ncbi:hypothetical protein ACFLWR_01880 [Chloroflexota bacterium]
MNVKIGGEKSKPRVALLGTFSEEDVSTYKRMFPTVWSAVNQTRLKEIVDPREIDLIIIAPDIQSVGVFTSNSHIICFSNYTMNLPGPSDEYYVGCEDTATTEEYYLPSAVLAIDRLRATEFNQLQGVRGWKRIKPKSHLYVPEDSLNQYSIISERITEISLAVMYQREETSLAVALLPFSPINQTAWVEVIVGEWAKVYKESFPFFGDWSSTPEWMVKEEREILSSIANLEEEKHQIILQTNSKISELSLDLEKVKKSVNEGLRRLITEQGTPLVEEVASVLKKVGFNVEIVDQSIDVNAPKREDLRLTDSKDVGSNWEAIVEVRGYSKSGGSTADLQRLNRFSTLYHEEKGRFPEKMIYIVNGQIELLPAYRQISSSPAQEDVQIFAESNGLVIATIDLFRRFNSADAENYPEILESIRTTTGRWH